MAAAKRSSRKRRRGGGGAGTARSATAGAEPTTPGPATREPVSTAADEAGSLRRGYARGRAKDEAARAALEPLEPGERPGAVTAGAVVAALLCVANLVSMAFGYNTDEGGRLVAGTVIVALVLALVAWGMWQAKYWAVLGLQTLLAITIIFAALSLITAYSWWAAGLMVLIIASSGTLFWFLVKAMARIQMPPRPGAPG